MSVAARVAGWGRRQWPSVLPGPMLPAGNGATISVFEQSVWPARIVITVSRLSLGDTVTVWRSVAGERTAVRGAAGVSAIDTNMVIIDAEQPFGVPLTYIATVNDVDADSTGITSTLVGGKVALSDAVNGNSSEVVITAWPDKRRERRTTAFSVGGRTIVVAGPRGDFTGTVDLFIETDSARENLMDLLDNLTSGVVQLRQAGPYAGVDAYLAVLADVEHRFSQDGSDQRRTWSLDVAEVQAWSAAYEAQGFTLQDIADTYTGSLLDIAAAFQTLLDIAVGVFG